MGVFVYCARHYLYCNWCARLLLSYSRYIRLFKRSHKIILFYLFSDPSCVDLEVSFEEKAEDDQLESQIKTGPVESSDMYINDAFASQNALAHSDFSINNSSTHAIVSEETNQKRSEHAISIWQALFIPVSLNQYKYQPV